MKQLLEVISMQVVVKDTHFYHYGEPKRLALPAIYIVLTEKLTQHDINQFVGTIIDPAPFRDWRSVYSSYLGLAKLHNSRSFLNNLFIISGKSENWQLKKLYSQVEEALNKLKKDLLKNSAKVMAPRTQLIV